MKDVYVLQEQIQELNLNDDSSKVIFNHYEKDLYKKHQMDDSIYKESFKYYMDDVDGLAKIYEIIADSLSLEEKLINANQKAQENLDDEDY